MECKMDQLELLKLHVDAHVDTSRDATTRAFAIEPVVISGAVLVRNVPLTSADKLKEAIELDVKQLNIDGIRLLAKKQITVEDSLYTLMHQQAENDGQANLRFLLQYTGPKMKEPPRGIYTKKAETSHVLTKLIQKNVPRIQLEAMRAERQAESAKKPVDVTLQTHFLKFVGKHTDFEMVFKIIPNQKRYGELAVQFMPKILDGITINEVSYDRKSGQSTWKMNAAGKPYLVRIGKELDKMIKQGG
jgi:hypothetical protein